MNGEDMGGVPMGNPLDPNEHPANNLASPGGLPLGKSGDALAGDSMDPAALAAALGKKYHTTSKKRGKTVPKKGQK